MTSKVFIGLFFALLISITQVSLAKESFSESDSLKNSNLSIDWSELLNNAPSSMDITITSQLLERLPANVTSDQKLLAPNNISLDSISRIGTSVALEDCEVDLVMTNNDRNDGRTAFIDVYFNGVNVGTINNVVIPAFTRLTLTVTFSGGFPAGTHQLNFVLNVSEDSTPNNNTASTNYTWYGNPDFRINSLSFAEVIAQNTTFEATFFVENYGNADDADVPISVTVDGTEVGRLTASLPARAGVNGLLTFNNGLPAGARTIAMRVLESDSNSSDNATSLRGSWIGIAVTSADVTADQIQVEMIPASVSGTFTLSMAATDSTTHTIFTGTRSGGLYNQSFNVPGIPLNRQYTSINARWVVNGVPVNVNRNFRMQKLGTYRHSQYNIPSENLCSATPVSTGYTTTSACAFGAATLRTQFFNQVNLNGSGRSISYGNIGREFFCIGQPNAPADASGKSFRQGIAFAGGCQGANALTNNTVAVLPSHSYLSCGDQVYLVGQGVKTVTDFCPGCAQQQLDNFTTSGLCSGITDLGNYVTIKLN